MIQLIVEFRFGVVTRVYLLNAQHRAAENYSKEFYCNFVYSALAAFRIGMSGVGVFPEGEDILVGSESRADDRTSTCSPSCVASGPSNS